MQNNRNIILGVSVLALVGITISIYLVKHYSAKPQPKVNLTAGESAKQDTTPVSPSSQTDASRTTAAIAPAAPIITPQQGLPAQMLGKNEVSKVQSTTPPVSQPGAQQPSSLIVPNAAVGTQPGTPSVSSPIPGPNVPSVNGPVVQNKESTIPKKKEEEKISKGCVMLTFAHKKISSHEDGEACSKHKNLLTLKFPQQAENAVINTKSICVQVNGSTVKHVIDKKNPNQVIIGPDAGPHAKITVRYCLGNGPCEQKCPVAEDKFMAELGAGASDDSAEEDNPEMEKEVIQLVRKIDEIASESTDDLFKDWFIEKNNIGCGPSSVAQK